MAPVSSNNKDIAEFLRLGLCLGLFKLQSAVQWADSRIAEEDKPSMGIISVSLAGTRSELIDSLSNVEGSVRPEFPVKLLLAYCWRQLSNGQLSSDYLSGVLFRLKRMPEVHSEIRNTLYVLDEDLSRAEDGVGGSVEAAMQNIEVYLSKFQEYVQLLPTQV